MPSSGIHVVIQDLARIVFEGDVAAISSTNDKGPFDILSLHENFITLIKDHVTLTHLDGAKQRIKLNTGVLRNVENSAQIFIGVETL